jgi:hypothetical protein
MNTSLSQLAVRRFRLSPIAQWSGPPSRALDAGGKTRDHPDVTFQRRSDGTNRVEHRGRPSARGGLLYVTDLSRLEEWQESLVSSRAEGGGPRAVGSKVVMVRRLGRREQTSTMETTSFSPPTSWAARGIDGPVRAILNGTVEPLDDGARSRVTIELDFEGRGLGKLLVPLVVRRQAQEEMPRNMRNLKERLESSA